MRSKSVDKSIDKSINKSIDNTGGSDKNVKDNGEIPAQVCQTSIGGSALIEGLMMIGPERAAIGIRMPDGNIVLDERPVPKRDKLSKIPLVRGVINFVRQMVITYKAMTYSAKFIDIEEDEEEKEKEKGKEKGKVKDAGRSEDNEEKEQSRFDAWLEKKLGSDKAMDVIIYISIAFSLVVSVLLFSVAPYYIVSFFTWLLGVGPKEELSYAGNLLFNLSSGVIRMLIFIGYLMLASLMNDIKRVWQYHGSEHKTIHCYEHGEPLTVENIKKYSKHHPRCGTSFMLIIMVLGILIASAVKLTDNSLVNVLIRVALIPVVAAVSYEVLKFAGTATSKWITWLNAPGMWFQRLTTKEPDDDMIEVAIIAMINAMPEKEREEALANCDIPFKTDAQVQAEKAAAKAEQQAEEAKAEQQAEEAKEAQHVEDAEDAQKAEDAEDAQQAQEEQETTGSQAAEAESIATSQIEKENADLENE